MLMVPSHIKNIKYFREKIKLMETLIQLYTELIWKIIEIRCQNLQNDYKLSYISFKDRNDKHKISIEFLTSDKT